MENNNVLKGNGFILRPIEKKDAPNFVEQLDDKVFYDFLISIPSPYKIEHANQFIERTKVAADVINWTIEIDGQARGVVGIKDIICNHKGTIGYWLAKNCWGRGIMSQVVKIATSFAFGELGLLKICATANVNNNSSKAVLAKNGFEREGLLKKHHLRDGKEIDVYVFGKIK